MDRPFGSVSKNTTLGVAFCGENVLIRVISVTGLSATDKITNVMLKYL